MPTYTFCCPRCKHKFTDLFRMQDSDGKKVVCPKCQKKGVGRVYERGFSLIVKTKKARIPTCSSGVCGLESDS